MLILSCAKSANPEIRANSISLFKITTEKATDESKEATVEELLKLAQAGKAIGPDRKVLYTMFSFLSTSAQVSSLMVKVIPSLLAKETSEVALPILASSLTKHLAFYLREDLPFPDEVSKLLTTEMQNNKPPIRRAFVTLAGNTFWDLGNLKTANAVAFARAVFPGLESSLKSVAANPLNTAGGPVEGYIATAVLLGPFSRSRVFGNSHVSIFFLLILILITVLEDDIPRNTTVQAIVSSSRPSFLVWDKVYQRLTDVEEETWLLRALESTTIFFSSEVEKAEQLRSVFRYFCVYSVCPSAN